VAEFLASRVDRLARLGASPRATGLLLLQNDPDLRARAASDAELLKAAAAARDAACPGGAEAAGCGGCFYASGAAAVHVGLARRAWSLEAAAEALGGEPSVERPARRTWDAFLLHPVGGFLALASVLYALYLVVGVFGAGTVVDWIEGHIFEEHLTPWMAGLVDAVVPGEAVRSLLTGHNGLWTLAVTYAVAIIIPVVGLFYLCFGILEDSGYLPRLGVLVHRFLARIGLGGQAAIPLILGLGCVTTATLATRALPTRRERLIAVLLMSLATPCAAQLGVVLAILSFSPWALVVWAGVVLLAFLVTGLAAGRGLPGPPPRLLTELPPLRWPSPWHIARKSTMRIGRYLLEVLPYFAAASVILWGLEWTGLLGGVEAALRPLARLAGLPAEASRFLLFGFFRRDYGAAGLYDLATTGLLGTRQLVVAAVLLTLFIPCIAQLMVLRKEFGFRTTAAIVVFVFVAAFAAAGMLNAGLTAYGL
jgi:ferrous iron transport protein B